MTAPTRPTPTDRRRIRGAYLVTMDPGLGSFRGDLDLEGNRIRALGDNLDRPGEPEPDVIEDGRNWIVMPGFVQAHVHLCQSLFRGLAGGLPLSRWLEERIWPLEAAHDEMTLAAAARLGIAECLLHGTTTLLDMGSVHHTGVIAEAADAMGIRATLGKALMDTGDTAPPALIQDAEVALREALDLNAAWDGRGEQRLRVALAPRFTLSVSDGLWRELAAEARRRDLLVHTHVSETDWENDTCLALHGDRPLGALGRWGVLDARTALVHAVRLEPSEIDLLAEHPAAVIHCPGSNAKLGSGIADVAALREAHVPVGLGSDGTACNDTLSPLLEMRLAAQLQSLRHGPARMPASEVLRMATVGGAEALGRGEEIGSLTPGRQADWIAYSAADLPLGDDVADTLVWSAAGARPSEVSVAGRRLVTGGRLCEDSLTGIRESAQRARRRLRERAGI